MSRFVTDIGSSKPETEIDTIIQRFVKKEGFKPKKYKGVNVYKSGIGFLTASKFMIIERRGNSVHIEAWVKAMGEQNLDGVVAVVPKKQLKGKVNKLIAELE